MKYLRLIWWFATALTYNAVSILLLQTLGYVLVPLAILFRQQQTSYVTGEPIVNAPGWLWLYGNDEDGLDPPWYQTANPTWSPWLRMWVWAAWRNPVNNLRFIKSLHPPPRVGGVKLITFGPCKMLYQDWACNLLIPIDRWFPSYQWYYIGWKYWLYDLEVTDYSGDWRRFGCGFGSNKVKK